MSPSKRRTRAQVGLAPVRRPGTMQTSSSFGSVRIQAFPVVEWQRVLPRVPLRERAAHNNTSV